MNRVIRIGTRGSQLALAQTELVMAAVQKRYPNLQMEMVVMRTKGDNILDKPLVEFGGKGAFVAEFEEALLTGEIDLAVHSAKDMPMELSAGLVVAGTLPRADVRDVLVMRKGLQLETNETNPIRIGTGSLRRQFQVKKMFSNVECVAMRGNVPTRLEKIKTGQCDGVILAAAGLERLHLIDETQFDYHFFTTEEMVSAGGQGIIAIEGRQKDEVTKIISAISDEKSFMELETEREVLCLLNAGCHEAIGVLARVEQEQIFLQITQEMAGRIVTQSGRADVEQRLNLAKELVRHMND
jgi:hydroxymethylbilane synthase